MVPPRIGSGRISLTAPLRPPRGGSLAEDRVRDIEDRVGDGKALEEGVKVEEKKNEQAIEDHRESVKDWDRKLRESKDEEIKLKNDGKKAEEDLAKAKETYERCQSEAWISSCSKERKDMEDQEKRKAQIGDEAVKKAHEVADAEKKKAAAEKKLQKAKDAASKYTAIVESVTGTLTELGKCLKDSSSCDFAGTGIKLLQHASAVMTAAAFMLPWGPVISSAIQWVLGFFKAGVDPGPLAVNKDDLEYVVKLAISNNEVDSIQKSLDSSLEQLHGTLTYLAMTIVRRVEHLNGTVPDKRYYGELEMFKEFFWTGGDGLLSIRQARQNLFLAVLQTFGAASGEKTKSLRANLLDTTPFESNCWQKCSEWASHDYHPDCLDKGTKGLPIAQGRYDWMKDALKQFQNVEDIFRKVEGAFVPGDAIRRLSSLVLVSALSRFVMSQHRCTKVEVIKMHANDDKAKDEAMVGDLRAPWVRHIRGLLVGADVTRMMRRVSALMKKVQDKCEVGYSPLMQKCNPKNPCTRTDAWLCGMFFLFGKGETGETAIQFPLAPNNLNCN